MKDTELLERAYGLASSHNPHPNPRVGAVLLGADGRIIGEGAHAGPGSPHAEALALDSAASAAGATVYVSLEPCSHHGRTPPCTDALIAAGVRRVVIGAIDPDPRVAGSGVERLRSAGIEVEVMGGPEAVAVDPGYFHHRTTGLPLVTLKYAMTLDGSVAARDGSSRWVTGEGARTDAHRLRGESDAVVVGAGTLRRDDPYLDVRLDGFERSQPVPVVIAGASELPVDRRLWEREPLVFSSRRRQVPSGRCEVVEGSDWPEPEAVARRLADLGMLTVLLEGGPTIAGAWVRSGVVKRVVAYVGAKLGLGSGMQPLSGDFTSIDEARAARINRVERLGSDLRVDYEMS